MVIKSLKKTIILSSTVNIKLISMNILNKFKIELYYDVIGYWKNKTTQTVYMTFLFSSVWIGKLFINSSGLFFWESNINFICYKTKHWKNKLPVQVPARQNDFRGKLS